VSITEQSIYEHISMILLDSDGFAELVKTTRAFQSKVTFTYGRMALALQFSVASYFSEIPMHVGEEGHARSGWTTSRRHSKMRVITSLPLSLKQKAGYKHSSA